MRVALKLRRAPSGVSRFSKVSELLVLPKSARRRSDSHQPITPALSGRKLSLRRPHRPVGGRHLQIPHNGSSGDIVQRDSGTEAVIDHPARVRVWAFDDSRMIHARSPSLFRAGRWSWRYGYSIQKTLSIWRVHAHSCQSKEILEHRRPLYADARSFRRLD